MVKIGFVWIGLRMDWIEIESVESAEVEGQLRWVLVSN